MTEQEELLTQSYEEGFQEGRLAGLKMAMDLVREETNVDKIRKVIGVLEFTEGENL
jgi:hypothetical protein